MAAKFNIVRSDIKSRVIYFGTLVRTRIVRGVIYEHVGS